MSAALTLPRLVFGRGKLASLSDELAMLGVTRPLLVSDRGLDKAGIVARVAQAAPTIAAQFLDVPENPTAAGVEQAAVVWRENGCDSIIALGGGSVLDTAKLLSSFVTTGLPKAAQLIANPALVTRDVIPLIAVPTTIGTGAESSPVTGLHIEPGQPAVGTRSPFLVPRVALCDPDLTRTLPPRLIAATGIDALSHCIEGFLANSTHPIIDALALDGIRRVVADIADALRPDGDDARGSLMAAAYAGGVAIHKGLGPAHAFALAFSDQHVHHGTMVGVALPWTTRLVAQHNHEKANKLREALGLLHDADIGDALAGLIASLGVPTTLAAAGYALIAREHVLDLVVASHFNRTSGYVPKRAEYGAILDTIAG